MSIKVEGRSRSYRVKITRGESKGGFRNLTSADRKVWARYEAY